jgi:hypothetical protein
VRIDEWVILLALYELQKNNLREKTKKGYSSPINEIKSKRKGGKNEPTNF